MSSYPLGRQAAEARLEQMLVDYRDSLPRSYRIPLFGSDPLREAIAASPDLKDKLVDAIGNGYLTRFSNAAVEDGAAAGYATASREMRVPESALGDRNELVFVLGHETQHARSQKGVDYRGSVLVPGLTQITSAPPPHDYTAPIEHLVNRTLAEEAQAHVGGFNAAVSALAAQGTPATPANLYAFNPNRMRDFIDVQGAFPNHSFQLKAGLTQNRNGTLDFSAGNIDAMKQYYPDKMPGSFGSNGLLNYRHNAVLNGWQMAHEFERYGMAGMPRGNVQVYTIDFGRLGINPALLNVPPDGKTVATNPIASGTVPDFNALRQQRVPLSALLDDFPKDAVVDRRTAQSLLDRASAPAPALASGSGVQPPSQPLPTTTATTSPRAPDAMQSDLYMQAISGLRGANIDALRGDREALLNVAASLALEAQAKGLTSIDHVVKGDKGNVFAIQGEDARALGAPRAAVDVATAAKRPSEESLGQLHTELSRASQQQTATLTQSPHRLTQ